MKTMKNYIWMAAIAMTAATFTACSSDELATKEAPVQKNNVVTLTATLNTDGDAATRSTMNDNGTTITTAWEVGDKIWVNYDDTGDNNRVAKGTVSAVTDGKATVTVDLVNPKDASIIVFGFPYDHWTEAKDVRIDQLGTLDDINLNHAAISGSGTLTVVGSIATLPDNVSMNQEMAIWKLNFKDGGTDITDQITSLNISFGPSDDYMITPNAQSDIYVALYPVDGGNITITAATATGNYSYSKSGVTLDNGKFYRSEVAMSAAAASNTYRVFTSRTAYSDVAIPGGATTVTSETTAWTNGTYVVSGNVTINSHVSVTGDVNLILKDGASLTVNNTITGDNLNIYGQELSTGKLDVVYHDINVSVSNLAIHGGVITVTEGGVQQGLEAMNIDIYHGKVTTTGAVNGFMVMGNMRIFGGDITATSTGGAALQIYGSGVPGSLTMTGGTFRATGTGTGSYNKGILVEEGNGEGTATITISGGTLIATGGQSPDDSNTGASAIDLQGTLTISGTANVTANGGADTYASAGGGYGINVRIGSSAGGNATISGGTVIATSGPGGMAAIYIENDLTISGATTLVDATGGNMGEGILANGDITISGGNVTATAGEKGIGLEGYTTISGGNVTAIGGDAAASSDGDGRAGYDGTLTMIGGKLIATGGAGDGTGSAGLGISDGSTIALTGVTMYEGDAANPATPAADQTVCTKQYVIIQ